MPQTGTSGSQEAQPQATTTIQENCLELLYTSPLEVLPRNSMWSPLLSVTGPSRRAVGGSLRVTQAFLHRRHRQPRTAATLNGQCHLSQMLAGRNDFRPSPLQ